MLCEVNREVDTLVFVYCYSPLPYPKKCPGLLYQNCHSPVELNICLLLRSLHAFHLALCMDLIHGLLVLWLYTGCPMGNPIGDERKDRSGCLFHQDGHGLSSPFSLRSSRKDREQAMRATQGSASSADAFQYLNWFIHTSIS